MLSSLQAPVNESWQYMFKQARKRVPNLQMRKQAQQSVKMKSFALTLILLPTLVVHHSTRLKCGSWRSKTLLSIIKGGKTLAFPVLFNTILQVHGKWDYQSGILTSPSYYQAFFFLKKFPVFSLVSNDQEGNSLNAISCYLAIYLQVLQRAHHYHF